ncbi:MAG: isoprenyl transferase [Elusimicrobia bacterium]|nr:isoprenyl transferase [Elusimicrobiota bacterium]MDE2313662.1 isoprenyl transferase [Elusimicrobiota bacterium]
MPHKAHALPEDAAPDVSNIPSHVAVIMDGNGRWARSRGLPRLAGHRAGVESVRQIVRGCAELGVKVLTLYSFSTENWLRPKSEVSQLMRLLSYALKRETLELDKNNVRLRAVGRLDALPAAVRAELQESIRRLEKNSGLVLNLALNYGSRQEIVDAANALIASGAKEITEESLSGALYTAGLPDPDLVIRTSGEMRLSNFLLWQSAYAEIYITPVFWPDFRRKDLNAAICEYQKRHRRFGGLG